MKRKVMLPLISVAALCYALFWASPYIFISSPKSPVLIVYIETNPVYGFYILEDGSLEVINGKVKMVRIDDETYYRRATEEEGHWKRITDRKRIQLSDKQFQKLMELAEYLDNCDYNYPIVSGIDENVYILYKGKEYYINYNFYDFSDFPLDDCEQYSNTKYVRELADLVMEYSPIPFSLK